jgi:hypothetical protein
MGAILVTVEAILATVEAILVTVGAILVTVGAVGALLVTVGAVGALLVTVGAVGALLVTVGAVGAHPKYRVLYQLVRLSASIRVDCRAAALLVDLHVFQGPNCIPKIINLKL